MVVLRTAAAIGLCLAAVGGAQAHVGVTPKTAEAGGYQVLRFGLGHGCDAQATTALRIEIPEGVVSARPQPKPGWAMSIERSGERVRAVTWRGALPADQYDEFLIQVHLPGQAGPLAFPAVQGCGATETRWVEPSLDGGPRPKRPAPTLTLSPPPEQPAGAHQHGGR